MKAFKFHFPKTKFKHPEYFFIGVCVAAWGLGFLRYIGVGSFYFPVFPNVLDVIALVSIGGFLVWKSMRPAVSQANRNEERGRGSAPSVADAE